MTKSEQREGLADVVEALIFASDEPLSTERLAEVIGTALDQAMPAAEEIEACVDRINESLERSGRPYRIQRWAGGYRMATRPEYEMVLRTLFHTRRSGRLTRSLLETLAIVAYRQPVTKPELDQVRGVDSDYALRRLMEIELVDIAGRSESLGRPLLYATTAKFMDVFGLRSMDDLPSLKEIEEILEDPQFDKFRAELLTAEQTRTAFNPSDEIDSVGESDVSSELDDHAGGGDHTLASGEDRTDSEMRTDPSVTP